MSTSFKKVGNHLLPGFRSSHDIRPQTLKKKCSDKKNYIFETSNLKLWYVTDFRN